MFLCLQNLLEQLNEKLNEVRLINETQCKVDIHRNDEIDLHQFIQELQLQLFEFRDELKRIIPFDNNEDIVRPFATETISLKEYFDVSLLNFNI